MRHHESDYTHVEDQPCFTFQSHASAVRQDVGEVLRREYPGGIDVAYEGVGGPLRDAVLDNLSKHGRMLAVGYISEYPHVNPDDGKAEGSGGLPPAHELFWQRQRVQRGDQIIYGDVWAGVSIPFWTDLCLKMRIL